MSDGIIHSVGSVTKSDKERIEVAVKEYKGRRALDIRTWYREDEGSPWKPGKGVWIPADLAGDVMGMLANNREHILNSLKVKP